MKIRAISFSLSPRLATKEEWSAQLFSDIRSALSAGADVIVFPELCLLGLCEYFPGDLPTQMRAVASELKTRIYPEIANLLKDEDVLLCLGSGPRIEGQELRNSAPIFVQGRWIFQDKIHLTPWETDFAPGEEIHVFGFRGLKISALICYDVEQPSLASHLKAEGIHFLLVPSATSDRNGNQRVLRCSSARSIELGAAVLTVPLIGKSSCDLVDFSEGRQGLFLPAQAAVLSEGEVYSAYTADAALFHDYELDPAVLLRLKERDSETKPYFKKEQVVRLKVHAL